MQQLRSLVWFVNGSAVCKWRACLIRSQNMGWSAGAVRGQLLHTLDEIDSLNPGYEGQLGAGRLNAAKAVTTTAQPELSMINYAIGGVTNGNPEPGSTVTMTVSLQNLWADAENVTAVLSTTEALVTLVDDTVNFGNISGYETVTNAVDTFLFQ
ncbi:MAG: hypothetical protein IPK53_10705 [bacterium]|nr:hypothetical protein [bacterium]